MTLCDAQWFPAGVWWWLQDRDMKKQEPMFTIVSPTITAWVGLQMNPALSLTAFVHVPHTLSLSLSLSLTRTHTHTHTHTTHTHTLNTHNTYTHTLVVRKNSFHVISGYISYHGNLGLWDALWQKCPALLHLHCRVSQEQNHGSSVMESLTPGRLIPEVNSELLLPQRLAE